MAGVLAYMPYYTSFWTYVAPAHVLFFLAILISGAVSWSRWRSAMRSSIPPEEKALLAMRWPRVVLHVGVLSLVAKRTNTDRETPRESVAGGGLTADETKEALKDALKEGTS